METSDAPTAAGAATTIASALGLAVDEVIVLHFGKPILRLLPCDVVARLVPAGHVVSDFEVQIARRLAEAGSPAAALEPRVEPRVYARDGFAMTLWTHYETVPPLEIAPAEYADALYRLHACMRRVDMQTPHFMDRVAGARSVVASRDRSPELADDERELLANTLDTVSQAIVNRHAPEQLLHGEPHSGNLLRTTDGLVFIDLETCCRGPVEFDIAHAIRLDAGGADLPADEVGEHYPGIDRELVRLCRVLMLAMITTWRWSPGDQLPDGRRLARVWTAQLRQALES